MFEVNKMGYRIVRFTREFLSVVHPDVLRLSFTGPGTLPADVELTDARVEFEYDAFAFRLRSPQWEGPAQGDLIPYIDVAFLFVELLQLIYHGICHNRLTSLSPEGQQFLKDRISELLAQVK